MDVNVNVNLYSALSQKNASNTLNLPSTDQKDTSSVYDENSQLACPAHANCFGTSSMSLVQRQRRCDGRTYQAEIVEQRVVGGWRNEDTVVQQLERPVCTAQTNNPVPGHACTCTPSPRLVCDSICHIEPMQLSVKQVCHNHITDFKNMLSFSWLTFFGFVVQSWDRFNAFKQMKQ